LLMGTRTDASELRIASSRSHTVDAGLEAAAVVAFLPASILLLWLLPALPLPPLRLLLLPVGMFEAGRVFRGV
jgi:hypothetical protein